MTTAEAIPLVIASTLGIALSPLSPYVFLPIAAAGLSGLVLRRRLWVATSAALLGAAAISLVDVTATAFVFPVAIALIVVIVLLARGANVQAVGAGLSAVIGGCWIASAAVAARLEDTTLPAMWVDSINAVKEETAATLGSAGSASSLAQLESWLKFFEPAWPSVYITFGIISAVLVIVSIAWSSRRLGVTLAVPPLARFDLTTHALWPLIAGVLLVAASYTAFSAAAILGAVGLNLLVCVRAFLLLQGLGVMSAVLDKLRVTRGGRVFGILGFVLLDSLTFAVSFTGLVDFWFNFRRLPREGFTPAAVEDHTPDR